MDQITGGLLKKKLELKIEASIRIMNRYDSSVPSLETKNHHLNLLYQMS
jgi:hypothetical protein